MTEAEYLASAEATDKPKVFFSFPTLGQHLLKKPSVVAAQLSMICRDVEIVGAMSLESSNLERNFNGSLMHALEMRDKGLCTHFAMHHADVSPETQWLDKLWAIMQRVDADIVSVVIAIKENTQNPRTSTAIADAGNIWHPKRFIHAFDRVDMPETFSAADVCKDGEVLLINTGCWLADLRRPFWTARDLNNPESTRFAFHRKNRIVPDPENTVEWIEQTATEDWLMSHHLHEQGARVHATWAINCGHWGDFEWPNRIEPPPGYKSNGKHKPKLAVA